MAINYFWPKHFKKLSLQVDNTLLNYPVIAQLSNVEDLWLSRQQRPR